MSKTKYDIEQVVRLTLLAYPLNKSEVEKHSKSEIVELERLSVSLNDDDREFFKNTIRCLNSIYMIYTADHSYEFDRDVENYNNLVSAYNDSFPLTFKKYDLDFDNEEVRISKLNPNHLKPEGLKDTGFRYFYKKALTSI